MSKTQKDFSRKNFSLKSLNILFFTFILLCSYTTVLNKLNTKKSEATLSSETQNNSELPELNISDLSSSIFKRAEPEESLKNLTSTFKGKHNEKKMQKQKKFEFEIAQLDAKNQTLNVSELGLSKEALNCYNKFELVINNYPLPVQSEIVAEFQRYLAESQKAGSNFDASLCCQSQNLIKKASSKLNQMTKSFTGLVAHQEAECKNGFACFRGNEVLVKALGKELDSGYKNKNQETLKNLLKNGKIQNSNLIKCLVYLQATSLRNLGLICANDDLLKKTFMFNAENKIVRTKKFPQDDLDFFSNCGEYVKNFNLYPEEITNAFIDSLNFLLGSNQCNYFSDVFAENKKGRKALDPKMFAKKDDKRNFFDKSKDFVKGLFSNDTKSDNSTALNSTKNELLSKLKNKLIKGGSTSSLIEKWASCASAVAEFPKESVESLKKDLPVKLAEHPRGLLGGKVLGVNFKEIRKKFDASSNPRFMLSCEAAAGCKLSLDANSNLNGVKDAFNSSNVVLKSNVTLEYSCCDRVCVVSYSNRNNYTNQSIIVEEAQGADEDSSLNFENILPVQFLQTEKNKKQLFDKILTTVGLKRNDTKVNGRGPKLILSAAEVFEIKPKNKYAEKPTNEEGEKIKSAVKTLKSKPDGVSFADENLLKQINEYTENPKNFVNDGRIKAAFMLNVKLENGNLTTLAEYLENDLVHRKGHLHLACAEGKCKLSQSGQEAKTLELAANTNYSVFDSSFVRKLYGKAEKKLLKLSSNSSSDNGNKTHNGSEKGFFKGVANFFSKKKGEAENTENQGEKMPKGNKHLNRLSDFLDKESGFNPSAKFYYRPNYNDLAANFTLDALDAEDVRRFFAADISKIAIQFLPKFNKTLFLEQLNNNFAQSFTLELECSEYFCVMVAKSTSGLLKVVQENSAKALLLQVRQRKAFAFDTQKLSITQKKCMVKQVLLNGRQQPEFSEVDLNNLSNLSLNSTIDSVLSVANKTTVNIVQTCNLDTPYTNLPITNDCLSSLVGHCQKSNFFDLYNRYTRGIASYDDLPVASATQNSCNSPAECTNITNNSAKEDKEKCGAALNKMLFINGSRLSLIRLVTPCNGDLPAASVEPISFAALENKKNQNLKNRKMKKLNAEIKSDPEVIDLSALSEEQRNQLIASKNSAEQNTEANVSIDGVTKDPDSVKVESDLAIINASVEEAQKSVQDQLAQEAAKNAGNSIKFGFYTVVLVLFALLI